MASGWPQWDLNGTSMGPQWDREERCYTPGEENAFYNSIEYRDLLCNSDGDDDTLVMMNTIVRFR